MPSFSYTIISAVLFALLCLIFFVFVSFYHIFHFFCFWAKLFLEEHKII